MKSKVLKKAGSAVLAAALALNASSVGSFLVSAEETKYEFENGTLTDCVIPEAGSERYQEGASGDKFVFIANGGEIATVTVPVDTAGMYEVILCYSAPYGDKIQNLIVNGVDQGQVSCSETGSGEWVELSLGNIKLNAGNNEIGIKSSWGWTNLDYIKIKDASFREIKAYDTVCSDTDAIPEAQNLMNYFASVYGEHIISGQQEIYQYGPHGLEYEFEYLEDLTGELPAIRGFDYGNFTCPAFGSDDGSTDRIIDWVKNKNGIATASWHINVPTDFASFTIGTKIDWAQTTYTEKTDFSPSKAATPGTKENEYYLEALTTLAAEFNKLEAQGIPVLWRPLHEAEGNGGENNPWFWWGREGSEAYKKLWIYTYETLTNDFDCHNLIWEWNSYNYGTSTDWYPGEAYVDIIGYDKYNCTDWSTGSPVLSHNDSAIASTFYGIMEKYNSTKLIAMTENDCFSTVDNLTTEKAGWLYFCTWYDGGAADNNFLTNPVFNTKEDTIAMYQSEYCITLDELPATLYSEEIATKPTEVPPATEPPTTGDGSFVFEIIKKTVDLSGRTEDGEYELVVTIEGEPSAGIGGALGFGTSADDWVNLEWSGNANSKGILEVEIPLDEVPVSITGGEIQVWWSNVWDSATESSTDAPCEIVDVEVVKKNQTPDVPVVNEGKGFYVDGQTIRDANGNEFIMRGVNVAHAWYQSNTETSLKAIADLGANCVRIVCSNGVQWTKTTKSEIEDIIEWCKENKLVCILEVHDATGSNNISDITAAAQYWAEMADLLNNNRKYVIVNIANEWYGEWNSATWAEGSKEAIGVLRDAGVKNMIMIDSAGWGQYPASIKEKGAEVFAADPDKNTVFSIHMYEYAGGNATMIKDNIDGALKCGAPILVGEFGIKHTDGDVDEKYIMQYCEQLGLGYIGWSWKGNSSGLEYLDLSNDWEGKSLTEWGEIFFKDANGVSNTSDICTVFDPSQTGPSVEATLPGDTNCNNDVEIADAIAIMSYVTNSDSFPLNEQQMANADVYQCGDGVGINDAVSIQKYITKLIKTLPESYNTAS